MSVANLTTFITFLIEVEDRIVGGLDPNLLAALADALEGVGDEFAAVQLSPELLIVRRLRRRPARRTCGDAGLGFRRAGSRAAFRKFSLAVMISPAGVNSMTAWAREIALSLLSNSAFLSFAAVMSVATLTTFRTLPCESDHRIVGGLDPDVPSAFADALVFASVEFAAAELGPEFPIFRRCARSPARRTCCDAGR